jgi:hypothetical protein
MMNAQDFCYWLHGFTELTRGQTPDPAQWKAIREHLDLVFKKVTPEVAVEQKITAPAGLDLGKFYRDWSKMNPDGTLPSLITC